MIPFPGPNVFSRERDKETAPSKTEVETMARAGAPSHSCVCTNVCETRRSAFVFWRFFNHPETSALTCFFYFQPEEDTADILHGLMLLCRVISTV